MDVFLIIIAIGSILRILNIGELLRLFFLKKVLFPEANIEQIENFEKNIKKNFYGKSIQEAPKT